MFLASGAACFATGAASTLGFSGASGASLAGFDLRGVTARAFVYPAGLKV